MTRLSTIPRLGFKQWLKVAELLAKRLPVQLAIRNLVSWDTHAADADGYTVTVACARDLAPVAIANLGLIGKADATRMHELVLVFDCPVDQIPPAVQQAVRESPLAPRITLLGYDKTQQWVARRINWGWVHCWLLWSLAIRHTRTRALVLHDLDAFSLDPVLFDRLYTNWAESGAEFCGIQWVNWNGIDAAMELVPTLELVLDASFVRRNFRPSDLFNKLRFVDGRVIEFDTMLYVQHHSPRRVVRPIDENQLVHQSQVISQYTNFVAGRTDFANRTHGLPVLFYLLHLGGDSAPMASAGKLLADNRVRTIPFAGRPLYVDGIHPMSWAWFEKQIRRAEQRLFGATRPEVEEYLRGFIERAGTERTVGVESGANAVPAR
jgi:hypothetical protein